MPENTDADASFRTTLRQRQLDLRAAIAAPDHARYSQRINGHLWDYLRHLPTGGAAGKGGGDATSASHAPGIGFCLPWRGECAILPLLERAHAAGWRTCVPVVGQAASAMSFRVWQPQVPLVADRHGIPVPDSAVCAAPDVLLLPVLAVDAAGFRLGYGGGYFDRTLAALASLGHYPVCIGVGFALARVASIRPQAHDAPLDALACEDGMHFFAPPATPRAALDDAL